ncbi:hypothetical protein BH11CYA1_BH11CYA1_45670 [soil metagenome]
MKKILRLDWDLIAGVIAAMTALVLHMLHIVQQEVVLAVMLVLLTLLLVRDLRSENRSDKLLEIGEGLEKQVTSLSAAIKPPDVILIGPQQLRTANEEFSRRAQGEMIWFNVCLMMFKPQTLFDKMLKPAVENHLVTSIQFVLDPKQKDLWEQEVLPKVNCCVGKEKVLTPHWGSLKESVFFILSGTSSSERTEALLSFWGEPFMAKSTGHDIPRYIFHVQSHSELITRLSEMERAYRLDESN